MRGQVHRVLAGQHGVVSARSPGLKYGVACGLALVGLAVRLALNPVLGTHLPFLASTIAVIFAAWLGGWGPGFVSVALSAVGIQFILLRRVDIIRMEVMRFCLECWRSSVIGGNRIATKRGEGIIYRGRREFGFAG